MSIDDAAGRSLGDGRMTRKQARECGALCTRSYYAPRLSLIGGEKVEFKHRMKWLTTCLKTGKYLVRGEARCGRHTPAALRTKGRSI